MSVGFEQVVDAGWPRGPRVRDARPATLPVPAAAAAADVAQAERAQLVALIRRMAGHDEAALAAFYDRTIGKLYAIVLRLTRSAPLAEEVVADTYYQAWRQASGYDPQRAGPLTWLVMMGRSRALDALRSRDPAVLHEAPEELVPEADLADESDPVDLLCAIESNHAVHGAVARLTPSQRQMVGLAFFRGLSHHEIAAATGVPLGTVKSQIRRALETMRRELCQESKEKR